VTQSHKSLNEKVTECSNIIYDWYAVVNNMQILEHSTLIIDNIFIFSVDIILHS